LITFVGAYAFREGLGGLKILFILLIIIGVMGLHWLEAGH
jgi:multidrug transporter EmrE-like cation transporter